MAPLVEEVKKKDIIDQLIWDENINANNIQVRIEGDTVILEGKVNSYQSKLIAEKDALQVKGVKHVDNQINVELPTSIETPDDAEIENNVAKSIDLDERLSTCKIDIATRKGIVTLRGSVNSHFEKALAEEKAGVAKGVLGVNNQIGVELSYSFVDSEIEEDIQNAFIRSALISEEKIDVTSADGVVTLTGVVSSYPVKQEAIDIAFQTRGVRELVDEITIG